MVINLTRDGGGDGFTFALVSIKFPKWRDFVHPSHPDDKWNGGRGGGQLELDVVQGRRCCN